MLKPKVDVSEFEKYGFRKTKEHHTGDWTIDVTNGRIRELTVAELIDLLESVPENFKVKLLVDGICKDIYGVGNGGDVCFLSAQTIDTDNDDWLASYGNV